MSNNTTGSVVENSNTRTIQEFREFLDKWEQSNNEYFEKCEADEANGELPLGQYLLRVNRHEQQRDIKTGQELLVKFAEYCGSQLLG